MEKNEMTPTQKMAFIVGRALDVLMERYEDKMKVKKQFSNERLTKDIADIIKIKQQIDGMEDTLLEDGTKVAKYNEDNKKKVEELLKAIMAETKK